MSGTMVGGYRVDRVLGRGGMGVVYEATQLSLNRTVALKLLSPDLGNDPSFVKRFRREGRLQALLDHPHIVTVHEAGESEHGLFIAMRFVRGRTLKDMIVARELDAGRSFRILEDIAEALDAAHDQGLIHRDIKPQNILVGSRDHAYLADFGLTQAVGETNITATGQFVGTFDYISPEQVQGERATSASDIYSFAAVVFECLTGVVPYPREGKAAVLYAHMQMPPPRVSEQRPELPEQLDAVIARGMAKDPAARYTRASEMVGDASRSFDRKTRAAFAVPAPVESPAEVGVRDAEERVPTDEAHTMPGLSGGPETRLAPLPATTGLTRRASVEPPAEHRRGLPRGVAAALAALLLAAALGVGYGTAGGDSKSKDPTGFASAGPLRVSLPTGWAESKAPPDVPGFRLQDRLAVGPPGRGGGERGVVAGIASGADGPDLLPQPFTDTLAGKPVPSGAVKLGGKPALRYVGLEPSGTARRLTVFVAPTSRGVASVICLWGGTTPPSPDECDRVAGSLEVDEAQPFPLGPDRRYAGAVSRAIERLNTARSRAGSALRKAKTNDGQATAAGAAGAAFRRAADQLARVTRPPQVSGPHDVLLDALRGAAGAWRDLGAAATKGDEGRYGRARRLVSRRERAVERALRAFRSAGYRFG